MSKKIFLILFFTSIFFTYPFFQKGFFATDDGEWAFVRLSEMHREIKDLQFPPRWSDYLNHGFGYPLFLFTYPLPYYFGEIIHLLGFGIVESIKLLFIISMISGVFGMYYLAKKYWGVFGALISAILYSCVPYRLIDMYIRGSLGEIIVLGIIPWLFWAIDNYQEKKKFSLIVTILFCLLILSHNASALFFSLVVFIYIIFRSKFKVGRIILLLRPILLGLLISSFFWIPAIFEKTYIYLGHNSLADKNLHYITFSDILINNYKSGVKPPLFIGYVHLLFLLFVLFVLYFIKDRSIKRMLIYFILIIIFTLAIQFKFFWFIWELPLFSSVDFPWRMLIVSAFLIPFIAGSIVNLPKGKYLAIILLTTAFISYLPLVNVTNRFIRNDSYYETNDATTTSKDELMPVWITDKPTDRYLSKINPVQGQIDNIYYNSREIKFLIKSETFQSVIVNTIYFPGWKFWINDKQIEVSKTEKSGLIKIDVPKGAYQIKGIFGRTPIRVLSDSLSLIGLALLILEIIKYRLK